MNLRDMSKIEAPFIEMEKLIDTGDALYGDLGLRQINPAEIACIVAAAMEALLHAITVRPDAAMLAVHVIGQMAAEFLQKLNPYSANLMKQMPEGFDKSVCNVYYAALDAGLRNGDWSAWNDVTDLSRHKVMKTTISINKDDE